MAVPQDLAEANALMLSTYASIAASLAVDHQDALDQLTVVLAGWIPPERVASFFEWGYAHAELLDSTTRAIFADVGAFATIYGFYGLAADARGVLMEMVLRGLDLPEGVTAPVPSSKYVNAPAPTTVENL